jgi:hypothetical protein
VKQNRQSGFTVVEMMCACAISLMVVTGMVAMFITHAKAYRNQKLVREMQQNTRFAVDSLARDIRIAGYGLAVRRTELQSWIPWIDGMTANPLIQNGTTESEPDILTIAAAFDAPVTELRTTADAGATTLMITPGTSGVFAPTNRRVIFIGRTETARILSRSYDQIVITTDPLTTGKGLRHPYPIGTQIEIVTTATYRCVLGGGQIGGHQFLVRDTGAVAVTADWHKMIASDIDDFQVQQASYGIEVGVTVRTRDPMLHYTDQEHGDAYRRMTVETRVIPRNSTVLKSRN